MIEPRLSTTSFSHHTPFLPAKKGGNHKFPILSQPRWWKEGQPSHSDMCIALAGYAESWLIGVSRDTICGGMSHEILACSKVSKEMEETCPPSRWLSIGVRDMLSFSLLSDELFDGQQLHTDRDNGLNGYITERDTPYQGQAAREYIVHCT